MRNPVIALIWETWRLSRRWYLWVLPLCAFIDLTFMARATRFVRLGPGALYAGWDGTQVAYELVAPSVFMANFSLAIFATLLAVSMGNRSGFPLGFEFRLPVKNSLLVAVPMLTVAALCASLYLLPIAVCRLFYGVPFPLLPAGTLVGTLVVILLACSWTAASSYARTFAMFFGIVAAAQLFAWLDPVHLANLSPAVPGGPPRFNSEIAALTFGEYALLGGICVLLFTLCAVSIGKQRRGEMLVFNLPGKEAPTKARTLAALLERAADRIALPCPDSSPLRAELWLELKRQVLPILLLSMLVAACIPLFFVIGFIPQRADAGWVDYLFPAIVFFGGIGIAVFNRRQASAGYMSAFEGTRAMTTLRFALLQLLSVAGGALLGMLVVCISLYFSSGLLDTPGTLALRLQQLVSAPGEFGLLFAFTQAVTQLVAFVTAVMLLTCVHTWSVVWGRWIPYGAGVLAIYSFGLALSIRSGNTTFDEIKQRMWAFAFIVFALTLLAFGRTLYLKVLSLRTGAIALGCWGLVLACNLYNRALQGNAFSEQAPELQAFNAALMAAPFLLFVLLLWSYDRLRHR
jgi:hypothetical protein